MQSLVDWTQNNSYLKDRMQHVNVQRVMNSNSYEGKL